MPGAWRPDGPDGPDGRGPPPPVCISRTAMKRRTRAKVIRYSVYAVTVALILLVVFKADWPKFQQAFLNPEIFADLFPQIITTAARNTIIFSTLGFTGGLALGLVLALMRLSSIRPYRWAAAVYIEVFRGIPALVTIILIGFGLPIALKINVPGVYGP